MQHPLAGHVILIIENEPLIALDIQNSFEAEGATTIMARTVAVALSAVETPNLSAAIVDHALGDGDSSELCRRLKERDIPFVTYSGFAHLEGACADASHVNKPASPTVLVATVRALLRNHSASGESDAHV